MRWHTVSLPASIIQASSLDNFSPKQNKQAVSAAMGAVHGLEWLLMADCCLKMQEGFASRNLSCNTTPQASLSAAIVAVNLL